VKGDIDGEIDARAMREDWEEVQELAKELGNDKWQYRALAQLGVAASTTVTWIQPEGTSRARWSSHEER